MKKIIVILLCVSFIFASCSKDSKEETTTTTTKKNIDNIKVGKVNYEECDEFLCATIKVPLDYKKPNGKQIDIAIKTLSAAEPGKRKGILLINPGGPGGSGVDFVDYATQLISPEVLDAFDIVGWDPRGVGQSSKLKCSEDSLDYLFDGVDYSPDDEAEKAKLIEVNKQIGQDCVNDEKDLAKHLTSIEATKDMDEIRKALGEKKINYLGFSYGTVLGQMYATLFPKNYRSLVIDGVVDTGADPLESAGNQGVAFDTTFDSFFEYCKTQCGFSKGRDPKTVFSDLVKQIDAKPIESIDGLSETVGPAQFDLGTGVYLYGGKEEWSYLDSALVALQKGDTSGVMAGYDSYLGRNAKGEYDGSYTSFLSILCSDGSLASGEDLYNYAVDIGNKSPLFAKSVVLFGIQCSYWPNAKEAKPFNVDNSKGNKVMVIGTTGDPATPVQAARDVAKKLENSTYLEFTGEGHTAYGRSNACVTDTVDKFLLYEIAPENQTNC